MSIREHRHPYCRKQPSSHKKQGSSRKREWEHNRAALARELRSLIRISPEG